IGSLAGPSGASVLFGSNGIQMGANNASTTFAGIISGTGATTKLGSGTMTLSGNNTYSGNTFVTQGTLLVNGSQPSSSIIVNGGTLGGTGTVAKITGTFGGGVSPGNSP